MEDYDRKETPEFYEMQRAMIEYLQSEAGQREMREAAEHADNLKDELARCREVSPETWNRILFVAA